MGVSGGRGGYPIRPITTDHPSLLSGDRPGAPIATPSQLNSDTQSHNGDGWRTKQIYSTSETTSCLLLIWPLPLVTLIVVGDPCVRIGLSDRWNSLLKCVLSRTLTWLGNVDLLGRYKGLKIDAGKFCRISHLNASKRSLLPKNCADYPFQSSVS